ncbi:alcohol dehydrogenase [Streptomyces sp. NPDC056983]|uniref:alcohol dehydrogenase n=1 Tax=Streptomyces sp. NPDC056983 TaxID=3345987 RepID=UPI003644E73C
MQMLAVVKNGQPLEALRLETPTPSGAEVLIEVTHCGVCHSDLHFWEGEYHLGYGKRINLTDRGVQLPRAPGHEVVGNVVALGPEATDVGLELGDQRIVFPWIGCGQCTSCAAGRDDRCTQTRQGPIGVARHGGFSSHVLVPHWRYLVDLDGLDPAVAATYACSGLTVLSALRKFGSMDADDAVVLIGAGGLGHSAIAMLRAVGHRHIIVVDVDTKKRDAVLEAGATSFIGGRHDDLADEIQRVARGPVLYAMDFVNTTATANAAFDSLGRDGQLILLGLSGGELDLPLADLVFRPRSVIGSSTGTLQDLKDVVALAKKGSLRPIPVHRMRHDQANEALQLLQAGGVDGRIILHTT